MVYLNRIYTTSGDSGETSLGNGMRVRKTDSRIVAYGTVDELNALLGVTIALGGLPVEETERLRQIQNDLFDLGADLCMPETDPPTERPPLRISACQVKKLEEWIDAAVARLEPLNSFVLPGGAAAAALLHQSRTVARRCEIAVLELAEREPVNPQLVIYLNRLSDLLFVMARMSNDLGRGDVLWRPGATQQETQTPATHGPRAGEAE